MIGKTIEKYRIVKEIGHGGMGVVYLGEHTTLGKQYALKILPSYLARNIDLKERFLREAKAQANLKHPYIVETVDYIKFKGDHIIVSEYIKGENLAEIMKKRKKIFLPSEILNIMEGVLDALDYVHKKKIIHRDLKPSNILLDAAGKGHISDFGIALIIGMERITRTGVGMGTPHYMSPEQVVNPKGIDHRSDIYSLGCILYEMASGEPLFKAETEYEIKSRHIRKTPVPVSTINPGLPPRFAAAIMKSLAKDPNDRFSSCAELLAELKGSWADWRPASTKKNKQPAVKPAAPQEKKAAIAYKQVKASVKKPPAKKNDEIQPQRRKWIKTAAAVITGIMIAGFIFIYILNLSRTKKPQAESAGEKATRNAGQYLDVCDLKADWIRGPSYGIQGSSIEIGIQYTNSGKNASDVMTYYYLSSDPRYDSGDFYLDKYGPFARVEPGQTIYHSYGVPVNIPADTPPGTWYLIYLIRSGNYNLTDNNASNDYTFYHPLVIRPAGKRCKIWIPNWHCEGPPHDTHLVRTGEVYKFHREVRNEGPDSCSSLILKYYWSEDGIVDGSDTFLKEETLPLGITSDWGFVNLKIPSGAVPGRKYWIGFTLNPKDCQLEQYHQEKHYSAWDVTIQ